MEVALKVENLNKTMGKRHILKDVSFETYKGEVFGFLGPNGAGKTTTIKIVVGMLLLDEGKITICGKDIIKDFEGAMANVGGIVENPEMYKHLSGMDNLKQYARMRKGVTKERIDEVVELVGLSNRINEKVKRYSLGMRQRLGVAQALLHNPQVLILDEPTNGLDPAGIKSLRNILKKVAHEEGVSVIVSSHLMSEMELMCDRVGIISKGEILAIKSIDEMMAESRASVKSYKYIVDNSNAVLNEVGPIDGVDAIVEDETHVIVKISDESGIDVADINKTIIMKDIKLYSVVMEDSKSLEDAFIEMTQEGDGQID